MQSKEVKHRGHCPNCGTEVLGQYCHSCGQLQESTLVPLTTFLKRTVSEYFSWDNRFLSTLKSLLFQPGHLTNTWVQGKRHQYTFPFRLYLIISLIYFTVLAFTESTSFFTIMNFDSQASAVYRNWLPRMMFLMMPLFAACIHLLHFRLKKYYVEHLVFSIHVYSFIFIISSVQSLARFSIGAQADSTFSQLPIWYRILDLLLGILPFIYMGLSLKKVYQQETWKAILKTAVLTMLFAGILVLSAKIIEGIN